MGTHRSSGIINAFESEADHVIIAVPFDGTSSGAKGADQGPGAIRQMLEEQVERHHQLLGTSPCETVKTAWQEAIVSGCAGPSLEMMMTSVKDLCVACIGMKQAFTVVGGEHSVTIPALKAYSETNDPGEVVIVHIDAHLDLRDIDEYNEQPYGKNAHCCVMRRAHESGFRILNIGARSFSGEEIRYARQNSEEIKVFSPILRSVAMPDLRLITISEVVAALHRFRFTGPKNIWVSIDADGICPADMPATGTPVGGGVSLDFVRQLIYELAAEGNFHIVGSDVVEVAPPLAIGDLTAYNAAQLVYELIGYQNLDRKR